MKPSSTEEVRRMYEENAAGYAKMMDAEIELPVYSELLGHLSERLADTEGALIDTACGSGHMLSMFHDRYDRNRELMGVDLAPQMVAIAAKKVGSGGSVLVGDMRRLPRVESGSAASVLNFFALHHLDPEGVRAALCEWHRVLRRSGQLVVATWEGEGVIDYGDESDLVALRYSRLELREWVEQAGFEIARCAVEPVEGFPMDAIYLEATKA
jgi:ubiquinone/menaquinone biosynthesis C-methylase UbiE